MSDIINGQTAKPSDKVREAPMKVSNIVREQAAKVAEIVREQAAKMTDRVRDSAGKASDKLRDSAAKIPDYEREKQEMAELYELAVQELCASGRRLVVWAGGDAPNQQDALVSQFRQRFPKVPIRMSVDLSKYHDGKVYQGLIDGCLTPDVVMLQTMHDFENWKAMGVLEPFKPASFASLTPGYGDADGAYLGVQINCFVPQYAYCVQPPQAYADFLRPEFKNRLILTPPHDDDAVLFVYDRIVKQYGEQFLHDLAEQKPRFVRGTAAPAIMVGRQGFMGNLTGYLPAQNQPSVSFIPENDFFVSWPQRGAMFKLSRHKAAARLFLAYLTSYEYQSQRGTWSVRNDVPAPHGYLPLAQYKNTDPLGFIAWMRDREHVNDLKVLMSRIFGPVRGESPLTDPQLLRLYGGRG